MQDLMQDDISFQLSRYFVIIGCIFIWIFLQTSLFRYDGMNLGLFRLYNDIIGNLLLAMAMVSIVLPSKKVFLCGMLLGVLSVGMDALLEMVINPAFGWYQPGGGAGTIIPTIGSYNIPYEMLIGFFTMGIVVATFTELPRVFRTSHFKNLPIIRQLFSQGLFKNPKYDRLLIYLSTIFLALFGAFGDYSTMALSANPPQYGPLLLFVAPWWTIWHTFLVWLISLNIGLTFYFYVLDKFHKRKFSFFPPSSQ
ncbi:MAG: hypothetical protein ACTSRC_03210 [Candidatus Helarchaeota archaeon]